MSFVMKYLILYYKDEKEFATFKSQLTKCDEMDYEEFCLKILAWENDIRDAFLYALRSGEYMQTRNSILVLDKINDYFPITKESGKKIESMIKQLEKKEKRGDLKQLCRAYYGKLQLRKKEWIEGPMEDEKSVISEDKMEDVEASYTSVENLETIKSPEDGLVAAAEDIVFTINTADEDCAIPSTLGLPRGLGPSGPWYDRNDADGDHGQHHHRHQPQRPLGYADAVF